jgi:prevent-host-death family protein
VKRISIQDLKAGLSAAIAEAESGVTVVITRHNRAVARLVPAETPHVHQGRDAGARALKPAIRRAGKIRYL